MGAMRPDTGDVHVDALLTNLSIGYINSAYIADRLFPIVFVDKQSDIIPKYDKSHWFRDEARLRGPGTLAHTGGWTVDTTAKYFCLNYAYGKEIPDEIRANSDLPFDMDRDATRFVTDKLQMRREVAWAGDFFAASKWGTTKTGGSDFAKFSDYGSSSPISVLRQYKRQVRQKIAVQPNVLVMGEFGWDVLADHPDLVERIKGAASPGSPAIVTRQLVAAVLELDRIEIGTAMYTTDEEGTAEASVAYTDIFDDDGLLMYVTNTPSLFMPSAGYTFVWRAGVNPNAPQYIRRIREERPRKDIIEAHTYFDQVMTASDAGLFLSDMVD